MSKSKILAGFIVSFIALAVVIGVSKAVLADDNQGNQSGDQSGIGSAISQTASQSTSSSEGESSASQNSQDNSYSYSSAWTGQARELENAFSNAFGNAVQSGVKASQMPSSLSVDPSGHVRITGGSVTAEASSSITVSVWGLSFNVNSSQAQFAGSDQKTISASDIRVGDKITVTGTLDPTTGVINAQVVVDYSLVTRQATSTIQSRINQLLQLIQQLQSQLNSIQGGTSTTSSVTTTTAATSTSD